MNAWLGKHIGTKRAISLVVTLAFCVCFVFSDAWALTENLSSQTALQEKQFANLDVDTFTIPAHLGDVRYSYKGNSDKIVLHIQDAHTNPFAQHKISDIINFLAEEYGIKMVNLEGGSGDYDLSVFTSISGDEIRKEVAGYFVEKGEINGAEYFAINHPDKLSLWGVEDKELYLANLKVYRDSLGHREDVDQYLKELTQILNNLKRHVYSSELLKIDMEYNAYKSGEKDFRLYLEFLIKEAKIRGVLVRKFPNLYLLSQAMEMEDDMDFEQANRERNTLIDEFKEGMSQNELKELISKSVEFKTKRISRKNFYSYLLEKARELGVDKGRFPALTAYIVYVTTYEAVDRYKVMEELDVFEAEIKDTLYKNDTQRELNILSKNLAIIKNIFNISMTRSDYQYYISNRDSFDVINFKQFINAEAPKYRVSLQLDTGIDQLDTYREDISNFYKYSFERDLVFLKNMRFDPAGNRLESAILMTGGFHTENLYELFRDRGISYVSILPKFTSEKDFESSYFELLAGQTTGVQQMLRSALAQTAMLQIASMLSEGMAEDVWGKANVDAFRAAIILIERAARGETVRVRMEDGDLVITKGPGGIEARKEGFSDAEALSIAQLMDEVHEVDIDVPIRQAYEAGRYESASRQALESAASRLDDLASELEGGKADRLRQLANNVRTGAISINMVDADFGKDAHPGGEGIHISSRKVTTAERAADVIVHEVIGAITGNHFAAAAAEENSPNATVLLISAKFTQAPWEIQGANQTEVKASRREGGRDYADSEAPVEARYPFLSAKGAELSMLTSQEVNLMLRIGKSLPIVVYQNHDGSMGTIFGNPGVFHSTLAEGVPSRSFYLEGTLSSTGPLFGASALSKGEAEGKFDSKDFESQFKNNMKSSGVLGKGFVDISNKQKGVFFFDPISHKAHFFEAKGGVHKDIINELNRQLYLDILSIEAGAVPVGVLSKINSEIKDDYKRIYTIDASGKAIVNPIYVNTLDKLKGNESLIDADALDMYRIDYGNVKGKKVVTTQFPTNEGYEMCSMANPELYNALMDWMNRPENENRVIISGFEDKDGNLNEFSKIEMLDDWIVDLSDKKKARAKYKASLGGKGAIEGEYKGIGIPTPDGFIITTNVYREWVKNGRKLTDTMKVHIEAYVSRLTQDGKLDVSVRSGAAVSMKGMMDTYLGVNSLEGVYENVQKVFESWDSERAIKYREFYKIPHNLGTAIVIQQMVHGDMNDKSFTAVIYTRNPKTGENKKFGEFLQKAKGEDIVSGRRTPGPFTKENAAASMSEKDKIAVARGEKSMDDIFAESFEGKMEIHEDLEMRDLYTRVDEYINRIRDLFGGVDQDIELTIEDGKPYFMQARTQTFGPLAELNVLRENVEKRVVDEVDGFGRGRELLDQLISTNFYLENPDEKAKIGEGILVTLGDAEGSIAFSKEKIDELKSEGKSVIFIAQEMAPGEMESIMSADATITFEGGATSHAAGVATHLGKRCVVGVGDLSFEVIDGRQVVVDKKGNIYEEGSVMSFGRDVGTGRGKVYAGEQNLKGVDMSAFIEPGTLNEIVDIAKNIIEAREAVFGVEEPGEVAEKTPQALGKEVSDALTARIRTMSDDELNNLVMTGKTGAVYDSAKAEIDSRRMAQIEDIEIVSSAPRVTPTARKSVPVQRNPKNFVIDAKSAEGTLQFAQKGKGVIKFVMSDDKIRFASGAAFHASLVGAIGGIEKMTAAGNINLADGKILFRLRDGRKGQDSLEGKKLDMIKALKTFRENIESNDYVGPALDGFTMEGPGNTTSLTFGRPDQKLEYKPLVKVGAGSWFAARGYVRGVAGWLETGLSLLPVLGVLLFTGFQAVPSLAVLGVALIPAYIFLRPHIKSISFKNRSLSIEYKDHIKDPRAIRALTAVTYVVTVLSLLAPGTFAYLAIGLLLGHMAWNLWVTMAASVDLKTRWRVSAAAALIGISTFFGGIFPALSVIVGGAALTLTGCEEYSGESEVPAGGTYLDESQAPDIASRVGDRFGTTVTAGSVASSIRTSNSPAYQEVVENAYNLLDGSGEWEKGMRFPVLFLEDVEDIGDSGLALTDISVIVVSKASFDRLNKTNPLWLSTMIAHEGQHIVDAYRAPEMSRLEGEASANATMAAVASAIGSPDAEQYSGGAQAFGILVRKSAKVSELFNGADFRDIYYIGIAPGPESHLGIIELYNESDTSQPSIPVMIDSRAGDIRPLTEEELRAFIAVKAGLAMTSATILPTGTADFYPDAFTYMLASARNGTDRFGKLYAAGGVISAKAERPDIDYRGGFVVNAGFLAGLFVVMVGVSLILALFNINVEALGPVLGKMLIGVVSVAAVLKAVVFVSANHAKWGDFVGKKVSMFLKNVVAEVMFRTPAGSADSRKSAEIRINKAVYILDNMPEKFTDNLKGETLDLISGYPEFRGRLIDAYIDYMTTSRDRSYDTREYLLSLIKDAELSGGEVSAVLKIMGPSSPLEKEMYAGVLLGTRDLKLNSDDLLVLFKMLAKERSDGMSADLQKPILDLITLGISQNPTPAISGVFWWLRDIRDNGELSFFLDVIMSEENIAAIGPEDVQKTLNAFLKLVEQHINMRQEEMRKYSGRGSRTEAAQRTGKIFSGIMDRLARQHPEVSDITERKIQQLTEGVKKRLSSQGIRAEEMTPEEALSSLMDLKESGKISYTVGESYDWEFLQALLTATQGAEIPAQTPAPGSWFRNLRWMQNAWWAETTISAGLGIASGVAASLMGFSVLAPIIGLITTAIVFWAPHLFFNREVALSGNVAKLTLMTASIASLGLMPLAVAPGAITMILSALVIVAVSLPVMYQHRQINLVAQTSVESLLKAADEKIKKANIAAQDIELKLDSGKEVLETVTDILYRSTSDIVADLNRAEVILYKLEADGAVDTAALMQRYLNLQDQGAEAQNRISEASSRASRLAYHNSLEAAKRAAETSLEGAQREAETSKDEFKKVDAYLEGINRFYGFNVIKDFVKIASSNLYSITYDNGAREVMSLAEIIPHIEIFIQSNAKRLAKAKKEYEGVTRIVIEPAGEVSETPPLIEGMSDSSLQRLAEAWEREGIDPEAAGEAIRGLIAQRKEEGRDERIVYRPAPIEGQTRVQNIMLYDGKEGLVVLSSQDVMDILNNFYLGVEVNIQTRLNEKELKPEDADEVMSLSIEVENLFSSLTRNRFLEMLRMMTGDKTLKWDDIGKAMYIDKYMSGAHKHVFKIALEKADGSMMTFAIATKIAKSEKDIAATEIKELEKLQERPDKPVPRMGGSWRRGDRRWYIEEFIEGDLVEDLMNEGRLTVDVRTKIISALLSISVGLSGFVPRDFHQKNFIVRDNEVVMVDIGSNKFNIMGKVPQSQTETQAQHRLLFLTVLMSQYGFLDRSPEDNHFIFDAITSDPNITRDQGLEIIRTVYNEVLGMDREQLVNLMRNRKWSNHFRKVYEFTGEKKYVDLEGSTRALTPFADFFVESITSYMAKADGERAPPVIEGAVVAGEEVIGADEFIIAEATAEELAAPTGLEALKNKTRQMAEAAMEGAVSQIEAMAEVEEVVTPKLTPTLEVGPVSGEDFIGRSSEKREAISIELAQQMQAKDAEALISQRDSIRGVNQADVLAVVLLNDEERTKGFSGVGSVQMTGLKADAERLVSINRNVQVIYVRTMEDAISKLSSKGRTASNTFFFIEKNRLQEKDLASYDDLKKKAFIWNLNIPNDSICSVTPLGFLIFSLKFNDMMKRMESESEDLDMRPLAEIMLQNMGEAITDRNIESVINDVIKPIADSKDISTALELSGKFTWNLPSIAPENWSQVDEYFSAMRKVYRSL